MSFDRGRANRNQGAPDHREIAMSERRFFVLCRETCPTCKGSGLVPNPQWNERILEADETIDPDHWAHAAGLTLARHMGPEEIPCTDCEGEGIRQYPVPLQEALAEIGR